MVGKSTGGKAETGKSMYPSNPINTTPAIKSEVAIGRRMKGSEMLTGSDSGSVDLLADRFGLCSGAVRRRVGIRQFHLGTGLEFVLAIDDHAFAGGQPFFNERLAAINLAYSD